MKVPGHSIVLGLVLGLECQISAHVSGFGHWILNLTQSVIICLNCRGPACAEGYGLAREDRSSRFAVLTEDEDEYDQQISLRDEAVGPHSEFRTPRSFWPRRLSHFTPHRGRQRMALVLGKAAMHTAGKPTTTYANTH
jgi:hypothetical protein